MVGRGTVLDPEGKPLAGVSVTALSFDKDGTPLLAPVVKTDAAGRYTIQAEMKSFFVDSVRAALKADAKDVFMVVLVHAPGYAIAQQIIKAGIVQQDGANPAPTPPTNELKLARGFSVTRRVVDEKGKPLVGVTVRASEVQLAGKKTSDPEGEIWLEALHEKSPLRRDLQVVTDTDGLFTLHDIPAGQLRLSVTAPTFITQRPLIEVGATPPAPGAPDILTLKLVQGTTLSGRVVYPDGKPVAGVQVMATNIAPAAGGFGRTVTTKADGTYQIEDMPVGKIVLSVAPPSPEWAETRLPPRELTTGVATKTNITLAAGVLLGGYVREEGTQAPLQGIAVYAQQGDNSVSGTTDAQGRYQIRVQPGTYSFWVDRDSTPDFLPNWDSQPQLTVSAKSKTAPDFLLRRGITLTGTAVDEKGQPAAGVTISVRNNGPNSETKVDEKGNWSLRGIDTSVDYTGKGKGVVQLAVSGEWTLLSEAFVATPAKPIALKLSHITLQTARVRVVTAEGQVVPGAIVTYQAFTSSQGDSWQDKTATTDAQGEALLEGLRPEKDSEVTAKKDGYALRQKGRVARGGDGILKVAQNVVMEALDAQVTGRVVDAAGQPAVGARVACLFPTDGRDLPDKSALTDAQGQFTLQGLPHGELVVGVAKGRAFGEGKVQANGTLQLKLGPDVPTPAPQDSKAAFALLEQWIKAARTVEGVGNRGREIARLSSIATLLAPYDVERAQQLMTDAQGNLNRDFAVATPVAWAYTDPKAALAWGKTVIPNVTDAERRTGAKIQLAALTARVDPQWARGVYDEVAQGVIPTTFNADAAQQYAQLAALASELQDPDAEGWFQALTLALNTMSQDDLDSYLGDIVAAAALGDLPSVRQWAAGLPPLVQMQVLGELISWGAQHNVPAAQQMLADLTALIHSPTFPQPKPRAADEDYEATPDDILSTTTNEVLKAALDSDPRVAQDIWNALPEDERFVYDDTVKAELMARMAKAGDEANLKGALNIARESYDSPAGHMAFIASIVSVALPQVSEQAFKDAREKLANRRSDSEGGELGAIYAYAQRDLAPEASRLLIESEWLRVMSAMRQAKGQDANAWMQAQNIRLLIKAMVPLSIQRANEMSEEVPKLNEVPDYSHAVQMRIVNWLLADAQTRRLMPLERGIEDGYDF